MSPPRKRWYAAWALSLATHALGAWSLLTAMDAQPTSSPSVGRHRGGLTIELLSSPRPANIRTQTAPAPVRTVPKVARPRRVIEQAWATPLPSPTALPEPEPPAAAASTALQGSPPRPSTPKPAPGAAFASLFAPIVRAPIGTGKWARQASPPSPVHQDPHAERAQAAAALRVGLQGRLNAWTEAARQSHPNLDCTLSIDTDQRTAQVNCQHAADQAMAWQFLQGLVVAGTVSDSPSRVCFRVSPTEVQGHCPAELAPQ